MGERFYEAPKPKKEDLPADPLAQEASQALKALQAQIEERRLVNPDSAGIRQVLKDISAPNAELTSELEDV